MFLELEASLHTARQYLLSDQALPQGLISDRLARSWLRCAKAGLSPSRTVKDVPALHDNLLKQRLEEHQELVSHAQPVMEHLFSQVKHSNSMVVLADHSGTLLHVLGDGDFLPKAEQVALAPGASWQENHRGTNAIGTALAEYSAIAIRGAEHFLEQNSILTCTAAPLYDPQGQILGVIDISSEVQRYHPHTGGLVKTAAQMIENKLLLSRYQNAMRLHLHPHPKGIGTVGEGIIVLSEQGVGHTANRAALEMLELSYVELSQFPLRLWLEQQLSQHRNLHHLLPMSLAKGKTLYVQVVLPNKNTHATRDQKTVHVQDALSRLDTGDEAIQKLVHKARKVAGTAIPILLHGESGVGKEWFAKAIHESGQRKNGPFVAINCAALPEQLIESELFGYTAGAFTGARREGYRGRIVEAHGGTLFLDEIGDMPLSLQSRLLRVLQEREVTPLGGGKAIKVDFSLVCATHRNLPQDIASGRFRADLYYRLNGMALVVPALRERSDFLILLRSLLQQHSPEKFCTISPSLQQALQHYSWPGNLRQLNNVILTAVTLLEQDDNLIDWPHLSDDMLTALTPLPSSNQTSDTTTLERLSQQAIEQALSACGGNVSQAARQLGISRNTLYRRLKG